MALTFLVMFTTTHLKDAHFVVLTVSHNSGVDACAFNQGSANFQFRAASDSKNLVDHNLLANIRSNLFYLDLFASSNFVLLATGFYDRVHISPFNEPSNDWPNCPPTDKNFRKTVPRRARESSMRFAKGGYRQKLLSPHPSAQSSAPIQRH